MSTSPTIFVSHGSPMLALEPGSAAPMLMGLGRSLPRPSAIVAFSPHWMSRESILIGTSHAPDTIHDFGGFDPRLYTLQYNAPGDSDLALHAMSLVKAAGWPATLSPGRGLDHGIWMPLRLMFPEANIPVVPVAMPWPLSPTAAYELGRVFSPLSNENILLFGTGSLTHNLHEFDSTMPLEAPTEAYVEEFTHWIHTTLLHCDTEALLDYRQRAPNAVRAHPTDEHLLPLLWAWGAAGPEAKTEWVPGGIHYASMAMDAMVFHQKESNTT